MKSSTAKHNRSQTGGATLADFGAAFVVFVFVLLLPIANMIMFAIGGAMVSLSVQQACTLAADSPTYGEALKNVRATAGSFPGSPMGQFAKISLANGGADLYVLVTDTKSDKTEVYGPNKPFIKPIAESKQLYQYSVRTQCDIGPFVNLSFVPGLKDIQLLGKPGRLIFNAERAVEHPDGLGVK